MIQMQNNKPVCTENILHITSGEMTANALRELLPQEEILPFNEAMCEGEVHIEIFYMFVPRSFFRTFINCKHLADDGGTRVEY